MALFRRRLLRWHSGYLRTRKLLMRLEPSCNVSTISLPCDWHPYTRLGKARELPLHIAIAAALKPLDGEALSNPEHEGQPAAQENAKCCKVFQAVWSEEERRQRRRRTTGGIVSFGRRAITLSDSSCLVAHSPMLTNLRMYDAVGIDCGEDNCDDKYEPSEQFGDLLFGNLGMQCRQQEQNRESPLHCSLLEMSEEARCRRPLVARSQPRKPTPATLRSNRRCRACPAMG